MGNGRFMNFDTLTLVLTCIMFGMILVRIIMTSKGL